jgi:hypothetical protein
MTVGPASAHRLPQGKREAGGRCNLPQQKGEGLLGGCQRLPLFTLLACIGSDSLPLPKKSEK